MVVLQEGPTVIFSWGEIRTNLGDMVVAYTSTLEVTINNQAKGVALFRGLRNPLSISDQSLPCLWKVALNSLLML